MPKSTLDEMQTKIWPFETVGTIQKQYKGMKTVLAGGCFDIIHYGHLIFFRKAKQIGDILIIALESDEFIEKRKHHKPFHTQQQRAEILASFDIVDVIILLPFLKHDEDYFTMVRSIHPSVIAVTEGDKHIQQKIEQAHSIGAEVHEVTQLLQTFSTSQIRDYATILSD